LKINTDEMPLSDSYDSMLFKSQLITEIILSLLLLKTMILSHSLVLVFYPGHFCGVYHCLLSREKSFYVYSGKFYMS